MIEKRAIQILIWLINREFQFFSFNAANRDKIFKIIKKKKGVGKKNDL